VIAADDVVAGMAIAAGVACDRLGRVAPAATALAIAAGTLVPGAAAYAQVGVWRNDLALFGDAAGKEPARPLWHHMLGRALLDAGRAAEGEAELAAARALNGGRAPDGYCAVPAVLGEMLRDPDKEKVKRVTNAFLKMKKLDIAALKKAYEGKG